ncbi:hypothetical protein AB0F72_32990 [Actinoplanes sp. NPDC023936]|uniref:hypothetical protein n=1 Tax=Actinoplanes sp. NPDC023936 TaxID=3154910 RepID=UPI0033D447C3
MTVDSDGDYGIDAVDSPELSSPESRVLESFPVRALWMISMLVVFFGWTPLYLLDWEEHSWNDEHAFWWRFTLFAWIAAIVVVSAISLAERIAHRRLLRRLSEMPPP